MSILEIKDLNNSEQIAQYVLEFRGQGHCLPYHDYEIVKEWIVAIAGDHERLLLILSDVLPTYYDKPGRSQPPDLKGLRKKVLRLIKARQSRVECKITE